MGQSLAFVQYAAISLNRDRRPIYVVQQSLNKIGGRSQIFQTLLILDSDSITSKAVCNAQRRNVHLALLQNLIIRQLGRGVRSS